MKFSYNWIREFVEDLDYAPPLLEKLITMKTAECEGIEPAGELLAQARVARVESVAPIPGSNAVKALVDVGSSGKKTVVCGAPNCRPGLLTAYVPIGKKTIHGVESDGMLASGAELGLSHDRAGVIEINDGKPGTPLVDCAPDSVIDIDNKSITHRPDLWGHHGMAREVAAILGHRLKDPVKLNLLPGGAPSVKVQIEDLDLCPRYSALLFENVTIKPSPLWLQFRLTSIGLNPINNIVDVTSYVMAELAQPMHAFDADLLHGDSIFVRPAKSGERVRALNDAEYTLDRSNLVIADSQEAIALAGVIGGADSAITDKTKRLLLESANFQAASVRKTSVALKLRTDASMRFEKAQDPANTVRALARAVELLQEVSPGLGLVGGLADQKKQIAPPPVIQLPLDWLARKLGRTIEPAEVRRILTRLEFAVTEPTPGELSVTVPSWRATKDISGKEDLAEEVGRMLGYDSITPQAPLVATSVPYIDPELRCQRELRQVLVDQGFTEVYNYSFISEESARTFGFDPATHVRVKNPIASDQELMRTSLLPGIWRNVLENSKRRDAFRLFEIGLEIHQQNNDGDLPQEIPHLMATLYERQGDGSAGLFEMKRVAECILPGAKACPAEACPYEHPVRSANIVWRGAQVGRIFELHPGLVKAGRAAMLDLNLRAIQSLGPIDAKYQPLRRFPSSAFDLSVIADVRAQAGELESSLKSFAGELLESIEFVRQYTGPPLPENKKSVSFRVTVGSPDRTLSSEEVNDIRARIMEGMRNLGYELRV